MKKKILSFFSIIIIVSSIYCNTLNNINDIIDKTIRFNNWQQAKIELETYIKNNPTDSYAYSIYAEVLNKLKLNDKAIIAVRTAINYEKSEKKKAELYFNLGNYYYDKDLKEVSFQMYNQSLSLNNNIDSSYKMIGLIYYENKDYDNALVNWKKYVTLTTNIDKKVKMQEIINKFEQQLLNEKLKKEEEKRMKEELMKKLMDELEKDKTESKSLEADKDKTKKSDQDYEEID